MAKAKETTKKVAKGAGILTIDINRALKSIQEDPVDSEAIEQCKGLLSAYSHLEMADELAKYISKQRDVELYIDLNWAKGISQRLAKYFTIRAGFLEWMISGHKDTLEQQRKARNKE